VDGALRLSRWKISAAPQPDDEDAMPDYARIYEQEQRHIWGLLYRITGSATDADDLLQDTFERAMTRPPQDTERRWRPWLAKVATNLARDALRRRKRRDYTGPWLPEPVPDDLVTTTTPEARYGSRESATFAFLKALEELTPNQRVVLVLRDVFDYTTAETATATDLTKSNLKVTLHRARNKMSSYDDSQPSTDVDEVGGTLRALMSALIDGDAEATAELLAEDVVFTSDAGGEFVAAIHPVTGRRRVAALLAGLMSKLETEPAVEMRMLNNLPAFIVCAASSVPNTADRSVVRCDVVNGRARAIDVVVATAKLRSLGL
jgi:RNA polymerase sigma-70 factor (ECF subfamily)